EDGNVRVLSASDGTPAFNVRAHHDKVFCVLFSPDNTVLATCGSDRTIKLWSTLTGKPARVLEAPPQCAHSLAFACQGNSLLAGLEDGSIFMYELNKGGRKSLLG